MPSPSGSATFPAHYGAFFNPVAWYTLLPFPVMPPQPFTPTWPMSAPPPGRPTNTSSSEPKTSTRSPTEKDTENQDGYKGDHSKDSEMFGEEEANQF